MAIINSDQTHEFIEGASERFYVVVDCATKLVVSHEIVEHRVGDYIVVRVRHPHALQSPE